MRYSHLAVLSLLSIVLGYFLFEFKNHEYFYIGAILSGILISAITLSTLLNNKNKITPLILLFIILGIYALFIESLSITTGYPYSYFTYGNNLGYKIFGLVPWTIFLIWPSLTLISYKALDFLIIPKIMSFVIALLILDLIFDPGATALGFWNWENPGMYYGVPFLNFVGWIISAIISYVFIKFIIGKLNYPKSLKFLYLSNLLLWSTVNFRFGFMIPVLLGIFVSTIIIYTIIKNEKIT